MTTRSIVWLWDVLRCRMFRQFHPKQVLLEINRSPARNGHAAPCSDALLLLRLLPLQCARSRFNHRDKIADCPECVGNASRHCEGTSNRNVGLHEIVIGIVECDRSFEVFQLLGKCVG